MRIFSISCFLVLQSLALFAQKACIEGDVVDTNGDPIDGIHVIGVSTQALVSFGVTSNSDGRFRIDTIPAGDYALATSDEYGADFSRINPLSPKIVEAAKATAKEDDCSSVTLREPVRARIHLIATDLLTAQPIHSPTVDFRYDEKNRWEGGSDDEHHLLIPPLIPLQVQAGATGYESSEIMQIPALKPGEEREVKVSLRPLQTGCIRGQVVDESGAPVGGVNIQPDLQERLADAPEREDTDKNGRFEFKNAHPGKYILFVDGYSKGYASLVGRMDDFVEVQPSSGCSTITVHLGPKGARLEVLAIDAFTHQTVKKFSAFASGITQNDNWSMRLLESPTPVPPFTSIQVSAGAEGYQPSGKVTIGPLQPEENKQVTIELYPQTTTQKKD